MTTAAPFWFWVLYWPMFLSHIFSGMSLSEPKRNASVPSSKPLHRVCKLEFLVFLEFNLRDLKLRVITVFYVCKPPFLLWVLLASKSMKRELVMTPEKCVKKSLHRGQHYKQLIFSHVANCVVGFLWCYGQILKIPNILW